MLARSTRSSRRPRSHPAPRGALPPWAWALAAAALLALLSVGRQIARKPTELLAIAPGSAAAAPATWSRYGRLCREHSTEIMRPELLAALVQVESAGDWRARTPWRWRWSWNPLELYAPASSAVGILQITDATFLEARRFCVHRHAVARDGPWHDPRSCWFNAFYSRAVPSHAIEMTSARLHQVVVDTLARQRIAHATLDEEERLAAVVHLCGRSRGMVYAGRGFRAAPGERCGGHDLDRYLRRVREEQALFARLDRS